MEIRTFQHLVLAITACALLHISFGKVHAQGTVRFENNIPGGLVTHVYGPYCSMNELVFLKASGKMRAMG